MHSGGTLSRFSSALLLGLACFPAHAEDAPDRCKILARALDVVGHERQRLDLMGPKDGSAPCQRPDAEGCRYVTEVRHELATAGRLDLSEEVGKAFLPGDCDEDLAFATKHGLPAYRDHKAIVDKAIEDTVRTVAPPSMR